MEGPARKVHVVQSDAQPTMFILRLNIIKDTTTGENDESDESLTSEIHLTYLPIHGNEEKVEQLRYWPQDDFLFAIDYATRDDVEQSMQTATDEEDSILHHRLFDCKLTRLPENKDLKEFSHDRVSQYFVSLIDCVCFAYLLANKINKKEKPSIQHIKLAKSLPLNVLMSRLQLPEAKEIDDFADMRDETNADDRKSNKDNNKETKRQQELINVGRVIDLDAMRPAEIQKTVVTDPKKFTTTPFATAAEMAQLLGSLVSMVKSGSVTPFPAKAETDPEKLSRQSMQHKHCPLVIKRPLPGNVIESIPVPSLKIEEKPFLFTDAFLSRRS